MSRETRHVLLSGAGSFLARAVLEDLAASHPEIAVTALRHSEPVNWDLVDETTTIANFALHPDLRRGAYDPALDRDALLAAEAAKRSAHYVMVSSRKVYGPPQNFVIGEDHPTEAGDPYGANRLASENAVRAAAGDSATILRAANIFGFELERPTFFGIALTRLRDHDEIMLDVSPFVKRDFLHVEDFGRGAARVIAKPPGGTFNIGSGKAVPIGRIALGIIEGYGRGDLRVIRTDERDAFELDRSALVAKIGNFTEGVDVIEQCRQIGRQLAVLS